MLLSIKVDNCFIYNSEIEFSMCADLRQKKFIDNVIINGKLSVLKSAVIIGPNNAGKTKLISCIQCMKQIMLNQNIFLQPNMFSNNSVCKMEIAFVVSNQEYVFAVQYDSFKEEFIYERFTKVNYDQYKNKTEEHLLIKDTTSQTYICEDTTICNIMKTTAKNNILIYLLDTTQFSLLDEIKNIIVSFASKIDIVDMNNIPIKKTIEILKSSSNMKQKIVNFILNADLSLEDFKYVSDDEMTIRGNIEGMKSQEEVLNIPSDLIELLHLTSVYKGVHVPSMAFDSTGTKKMVALASYVIDALENNRILIVDELDNSLHFKLTRAIIALFNNELNKTSQLICTAHDVTLLDCKKLFRKEQIWFAHKDKENAYLYSLAEFTAGKDGIRADTSDIIEKYRLGVFGALPEPDLFNSLLEVQEDV